MNRFGSYRKWVMRKVFIMKCAICSQAESIPAKNNRNTAELLTAAD